MEYMCCKPGFGYVCVSTTKGSRDRRMWWNGSVVTFVVRHSCSCYSFWYPNCFL